MTTKVIKRDDTSFLMSSVMPSEWGTVTAATLTVKNLAGTELQAATAVTIETADTSVSAVSAGEESITLTTGGTWVNGQQVRIGSDAYGWQHTIVESYNSSTKALAVQDFFDHDFPAGVAIQSRVMSLSVDTDTSTEWDSVGEVTAIWTPPGDDMPYRETWAVLDRKAASSGLEQKFQVAYGRYYEEIQPEHFTEFEDRARHRIKLLWQGRGRDLDKLVDNQVLDDLLMLQIAELIAVSKGDEYDAELIKIKAELKEQIAIIDQLPIWFDENEDDIQTEDEYQPSKAAGLGRGL